MKRNIFFIMACCFLFLASACNKGGEIVQYPSYGNLYFSGIFKSPLAVYVDGKTADTLRDGLTLRLEAGERAISFVDNANNILYDTVLTIQKTSTVSWNDLFYTGYGLLLPDMDMATRPTPGKMLVRFILTDKTLPDELNLSLSVYDFGTGAVMPVTTISGVRKDRLSSYIELGNPADLLPPSADLYYIMEGTDNSGNKVFSLDNFDFCFLLNDKNYSPYIPNNILSLGIGAVPEDGSSTFHMPDVIFQRIAP